MQETQIEQYWAGLIKWGKHHKDAYVFLSDFIYDRSLYAAARFIVKDELCSAPLRSLRSLRSATLSLAALDNHVCPFAALMDPAQARAAHFASIVGTHTFSCRSYIASREHHSRWMLLLLSIAPLPRSDPPASNCSCGVACR